MKFDEAKMGTYKPKKYGPQVRFRYLFTSFLLSIYDIDINGVASHLGLTELPRQYLWGQMSFWDRQTIKSPDASLTAARYGTVSLPDVECCYRATGKKYDRRGMLGLLREKAWQQWPGRWHWSFRNPSKVYGSPMLDRFLGLPSMSKLMEDLEAGSLCLAPTIGNDKESGARASSKRKADLAKRAERAKKRKAGNPAKGRKAKAEASGEGLEAMVE